MIVRVEDKHRANKCDELLTKLIVDECKYDSSLDSSFVVNDYFCNMIKNPKNILLCYEEDNTIKGYIFLKPVSDNSKVCLIDGLYVEEEYRKKGIASKLIEEALKTIKDNYEHVEINVIAQNEAAYKIYNKLGFKEFRITLRKDLNRM